MRAIVRCCLVAGALVMASVVSALQAQAADKPPLDERATPEILAEFFPTADRFSEVEGQPPAIHAFLGEEELGYVFSTYDIVRAPSYSPRPYDAIVGLTTDGRIAGIRLIDFYDSYLVGAGINAVRLVKTLEFLDRHIDYPITGNATFPLQPDFVQGVTISARSIRAGILDAARIVFRANSDFPPITEPTLDVDGFAVRSWAELVETGGIVHRTVTFGEIRELFAESGAPVVETEVPLGQANSSLVAGRFECRFDAIRRCDFDTPPLHDDDEVYIDFYAALGTPGMIGRNALTSDRYARYFSPKPAGTNMLLLFSSGPYNFRGLSYYDNDTGNQFDRFRLVQGDLEIIFTRDDHTLVATIGGERPRTPDIGAFFIPPDSGFDPLLPFEVDLLVHGNTPAGEQLTVSIPVSYQLPPDVILLPYVEPPPAWVQAWQESTSNVVILGIALIILTGLFIFQKQLAKRRNFHRYARNAFLAFTLIWLGWIAGGQLSIEHIVGYLKGPFDGTGIEFYLKEPLIVMISVYALLSLILIGRGVFCGWLCPFGAFQELTAKVGRFLHLPTWNPPEKLQRWLWLPKYGSLALIVGVAFAAPTSFATAQEIEPFGTAIGATFGRPWPYIAYAVLLLTLSLFTERFFCRFLCPLGGFLALGDRLHIFTFLKRRAECGSGGCHLCERSCPVRAIESDGKIIMAECFQCLDCQVEYYDDHRCPPLSKQRKQRERSSRALPPMGMPVPAMARQAASPAMDAHR